MPFSRTKSDFSESLTERSPLKTGPTQYAVRNIKNGNFSNGILIFMYTKIEVNDGVVLFYSVVLFCTNEESYRCNHGHGEGVTIFNINKSKNQHQKLYWGWVGRGWWWDAHDFMDKIFFGDTRVPGEGLQHKPRQSKCNFVEKNGRSSSRRWMQHMSMRYFFVADRAKSREVSIKYCPTGGHGCRFLHETTPGQPI